MAILIYTSKFSSRVNYAFRLIFREVLGCDELSFTTSLEDFDASECTRINYSRENVEGALQFVPHGLLSEKDISERDIYIDNYRDVPTFFSVNNSSLPFDVFSASFYLVSRYEEYLPFISDDHNRFPASESLAYKEGFLQKPLVNIWAGWVKELVLKAYPDQKFDERAYKFISTVDVDNLFAYAGKGVLRSAGAIIKDIISFNFGELTARMQTIFGMHKDVFDTFDDQMAMLEGTGIESIYFVLFAEFAQYDRNISMHSPRMQQQVRAMNDFTQVGIHPSYESNKSPDTVAFELETLKDALRTPVTKSRQHFLKMTLPDTFRNLAELGVTDEYSMGYASEPGFRASIATPFTFYDLEMEVAQPITIHPFMLMDVTFIDYNPIDKKEALKKMKQMVDETKAVNGQLISIFHNRVFSEKAPEWKGWPELYQQLLAYAKA